LLEDGRLACWGANADGQLGVDSSDDCVLGQGTTPCSPAPLLVSEDQAWTRVSAGSAFTCAIAEGGALSCWGVAGALGVPDAAGGVTAVNLGGAWSEVSAGVLHACAIADDASLWCWGSNGNGQLGVAGLAGAAAPVQTGFGALWHAVRSGAVGTCALDDEDNLFCWGQGAFAQGSTPGWIEFEGGGR
jgi:alpha-tubulin suppressor-like RCC1 family protein